MLEVEDPAAIPRWKRADAYERFRRARLEWLEGRGLDFSDAYWDEFTGAHRPADTMRHPPANEPRRSRW
jgi:hypothetical protein